MGYIQRRRSSSGRLPQTQRLSPRDPLGQRHAAQSGGSTAQAGADGTASSGSGTAAAPGSGSNGSSDGGFDDTATGQTVEEAMKELFGSLLVAYSDSTGQYEVLDTASLAPRASRPGWRMFSPTETALTVRMPQLTARTPTAARITASPWHGASTAALTRRNGRALS